MVILRYLLGFTISLFAGLVVTSCGSVQETPETPESREPPPFIEKFPAWDIPDLAIDRIASEPRRAYPGEPVELSILISNHGTGDSEPADVLLFDDGQLVGKASVPALIPSEERTTNIRWVPRKPGLRRLKSTIVPKLDQVDDEDDNNHAFVRVWVAGEENEYSDIEMSLSIPDATFRETERITLHAFNPSFVRLEDSYGTLWLDGERFGNVHIGPLEPGARAEIPIDLREAHAGEHVLTLKMHWPENMYFRDNRSLAGWHIGIHRLRRPTTSLEKPGKWSSLGPKILTKAQPDGSQGRVDHITVDPNDSSTLYATAVRGGLWKSTNGGDSWRQLTDDLSKQFGVASRDSALSGGSVAVDPSDSLILYYGTGGSRYGGGLGIFKSIDGGIIWHQIATNSLCNGVSKISVRTTANGVLVYAATGNGLLRYTDNDHRNTTIGNSDWTSLYSGRIVDMVADPSDQGRVYIADLSSTRVTPDGRVALVMDGLYRCKDADSSMGAATCTALTKNLPPMNSISSFRIDLFRDAPKILYVSLAENRAFNTLAPRLAIYQSTNRGDNWTLKKSFNDGEPRSSSLYNPYIRVHPSQSSIVWFGGVDLFEIDFDEEDPKATFLHTPHADQHGFAFDPNNDDLYYAVGDGGVWQCSVKDGADPCVHRNSDLRVMELYDFDVAENNPALITGGTQDNGTIVFTGQNNWNVLKQPRGGDGAFTPISPTDPDVVISQHQKLSSSWISTSGPTGPWIKGLVSDSTTLPNTVKERYVRGAYITFSPTSSDLVATVGDQVYATENATDTKTVNNELRSAATWSARGPTGSTVGGHFTKIVFQPDTGNWFAGTSRGQVWRSESGKTGSWSLIWTQLHNASVAGMAFAPTDNDVLYTVFAGGGVDRRVVKLESLSSTVVSTPMGDNFPGNREPRSISGDGYDADVVYVGTDKGVFQGDLSRTATDRWRAYNDGMPLGLVNDLVVPAGRATALQPTSKRENRRRLFAATRGRGVWMVDTKR